MAVMKKAESAAHTAYDALMTAKKEVDAFAREGVRRWQIPAQVAALKRRSRGPGREPLKNGRLADEP